MGSNMAVMYVWTPEDDSWGHASLSLNGAYISWWPTGDKSKNIMKWPKTFGKTKDRLPVDYEDDRDHFTGREYTHQFSIRIGAESVENIRKWWENIKDEGGYHFVLNNCCHVVVQALREGGIEIAPLFLIRTPWDMVELGEELKETFFKCLIEWFLFLLVFGLLHDLNNLFNFF